MLRLEGMQFAFGTGPPVVQDLCLVLEQGTFFSLLGPSGCGKTTLLRLIGGYHRPHAGRVFLDGRDVTALPPELRDVGMVFQNYALFPHLTARDNVGFGLEIRRVPRRERTQRIEAMLDRVGLTTAERGRFPRDLSGGQQQRVALARALVIEPRLLLLDEPLANLDRQLRKQFRDELRRLQTRTGVTTLLVTHDQEEALALSDRIGLMLAGRLLQVDTPAGLYHSPRTPFVAHCLGDANLLDVEAATADALRLRGGWILSASGGISPSIVAGSRLMIRPEQCMLGPAAALCPFHAPGEVTRCTFLGADLMVTVAVSAGATLRVRCRADGALRLDPGTSVRVGIPAQALWVIPEADPPWMSSLPSEPRHHDTF